MGNKPGVDFASNDDPDFDQVAAKNKEKKVIRTGPPD